LIEVTKGADCFIVVVYDGEEVHIFLDFTDDLRIESAFTFEPFPHGQDFLTRGVGGVMNDVRAHSETSDRKKRSYQLESLVCGLFESASLFSGLIQLSNRRRRERCDGESRDGRERRKLKFSDCLLLCFRGKRGVGLDAGDFVHVKRKETKVIVFTT
jgi:hypothetical protein